MRIASLLLVAVCGCAGADAMGMQAPAAVVPPANELGLRPGESMAFEVQLGGLLVGEAQLAVGEVGIVDGHRAVVVRSRAATAGAAALIKKISDEATTVIDVETGRPLSLETVVEQSDKRITASAKFTGNTATVTYQRTGDAKPNTSVLSFGTTTVHDAHTAMAQLRGWKGTKGQTRTVFVVGGRRLWRVDVTYAGEETIGGSLGNRRTIVFDGKSYRARNNMTIESDKPSRTFKVWLSDDADRVPIKVTASTELGEIAMDLVEYNRP
jgi:Protein of unknown function (DUF3108)